MHDLATIQRLNREAEEAHRKKVGEVYTLLDDMLYQWDNFEIGEVDTFLMSWAERLTR